MRVLGRCLPKQRLIAYVLLLILIAAYFYEVTRSHSEPEDDTLTSVGIARQRFLAKLQKLLGDKGTFDDMIDMLQAMGDNCTSIETENVINLQVTVNLAQQVQALDTIFRRYNDGTPGGHAGLFPGQRSLYVLISHQPWVKQVCEIGFKAGHSALFWLTPSNKTRLVSFDIAMLRYSRFMARYVKKTFPNRLEMVWGDSNKTVPVFLRSKLAAMADFNCDVIVIDGDHSSASVLSDLRNMRPAANMRRHLIIADDYPCRTCHTVGAGFVDARAEQLIGKFSDCTAYPDTSRGMAFGYYIKKPA